MNNPNPNASGRRPDPPRVRPQDLSNAIRGVHFPATKDALAQRARANQAVRPVIEAIDRLPGERFQDIRDVTDAFHDLANRG